MTILDCCSRCGKQLGFRDKSKSFQLTSYLNAIEYGIFPEYTGKGVCLSCQRVLLESKDIKYKGLIGMKKGTDRIKELAGLSNKSGPIIPCPLKGMKDAEYSSCINGLGLLEGEETKRQYVCLKQTLSARSMLYGTQTLQNSKGLLVFTNQNMIFMQQEGSWSSNYSQALRIPLENISGIVIGGTLVKHIRIRVGTGGFSEEHHFDVFRGEHGLVEAALVHAQINAVLKEAREHEKKLKEREHVQLVFDFSVLQNEIAQGGIVMTAYNCPKCNGMVDIPETGKILICKYCGTPIRPIDIFEKVKSLMH